MIRLTKIAVVFGFTLALAACQDKEAPAKPAAQEAADPNLVTVAPAMLQRLQVAPVARAEVSSTLRVPSRVEVDGHRVARIGAPVTGRLTRVNVFVGDEVQRGAVLASLNSMELGEAQLTYLKALSQVQLQSRAVDRARLLLGADVIGSAELQRRESELSSSQAELRAAADQLKVLGMSAGAIKRLAATSAINSTAPVTATLSGTVIARNVTVGQVVQPADELFTVADLSHVWVVAEVPEQQAGLVQEGGSVAVEIPALQNRRFTGKLIYVGDTVNPETRTVTVRTDLTNPDRAIKPDMLASMLIEGLPMARPAVPAAAVVRENNADHVFVQTGPTQFRLRPVTLGEASNGMRPVLGGLREGEKIVANGAFHLNNERKRKELE